MGKTKVKPLEETVTEEPKKEVDAIAPESAQVDTEGEKKTSPKKSVKPGKQKKVRSKKYQAARELVDKDKHPVSEAIKMAQQASYSAFPATIEAHINTNVKNLRGLVTMPYSSGKKLIILAFGNGAKEAGADIIGTQDSITEISKGKINFDIVITTPEWMAKLAPAAKILGPRGLMPNPKNGTITDNLSKSIAELQQGKTEYKTEKDGQIIHLAVGKVNQTAEEVGANIKALYNVIGRSKVKSIFISPTMGPSVKVEVSSLS